MTYLFYIFIFSCVLFYFIFLTLLTCATLPWIRRNNTTCASYNEWGVAAVAAWCSNLFANTRACLQCSEREYPDEDS